jgi:hypothetical protein
MALSGGLEIVGNTATNDITAHAIGSRDDEQQLRITSLATPPKSAETPRAPSSC